MERPVEFGFGLCPFVELFGFVLGMDEIGH